MNSFLSVFGSPPGGGAGASLTAPNTFLAAQEISANGAASTPSLKLSGSWFTGGSSTTTKPQLLVEAYGATSNGWDADGTGIGVNAASGFSGNLFAGLVNGSSVFSVDATGRVTANGGSYNVPWIQTKEGAIGIGAGAPQIMQFITDYNERIAVSANYFEMAQTLYLGWRAGGTVGNGGQADVKLSRVDAAILGLQADTGGACFELVEMAAPAAPSANKARIFIEDNGSGKTRLMVRFPSGASQQIAIEP